MPHEVGAPIWVKGKVYELGSSGISSMKRHSKSSNKCANDLISLLGRMPSVQTFDARFGVHMGLFGSNSGSDSGSLFRRHSKELSSSSSSKNSKSLSEVQGELVKKNPPGAVVILTGTPSKSADVFTGNNRSCQEWIEKFYKMQRFCGRNCPVWSNIGIEAWGLEVYLRSY